MSALLIELRVEELPAGMCRPALAALEKGILGLLSGIEHGAVHTFGTPRRLAVAIDGVAAARPTTEVEVTGPPAAKAFDADGTPTKMAEGFARGKGVPVEALYTVDLPKRGPVLAAKVIEGGESVVSLLAEGLAGVIAGIPFGKTMTWGDGDGLAFGRPLRGILAVYDGAPIVGDAHGLPFSGHTIGHRLYPAPIQPIDAETYTAQLRAHFVEPDVDVRAGRIRALLDDAVQQLGADPLEEPELAEEVLWLVEWPVLVIGRFDEALLELPPRLLITSMKVHQRYFPVHRQGALTEHFVVVGNNPDADPARVADGNARVLRARFHDARFFLGEDRKAGMAAFQAKLSSMRWIRGLGTMADKQGRLGAIGRALSPAFGADAASVAWAAGWSKADLASHMVGEFPELQGHMGRLYAARLDDAPQGAPEAIEAHYLPRFAGDGLPAAPEGAVLAVAERLDTLVGCFGIGLKPGSGGDPQGLRRAANGVVSILLDRGIRTPIGALVAAVVEVWASAGVDDALAFDRWIEGAAQRDERLAELPAFLLARYRAAVMDDGVSGDLVDAVVAVSGDPAGLDMVLVDRVVRALAARAGSEAFEQLLDLAKRVANIAGTEAPSSAGPDDMPEGPERALAVAVDTLSGALDRTLEASEPDVDEAIEAVLTIRSTVATFFDALFVKDPEDAAGTARRLGLLARLHHTMGRLADFSRISTR